MSSFVLNRCFFFFLFWCVCLNSCKYRCKKSEFEAALPSHIDLTFEAKPLWCFWKSLYKKTKTKQNRCKYDYLFRLANSAVTKNSSPNVKNISRLSPRALAQ